MSVAVDATSALAGTTGGGVGFNTSASFMTVGASATFLVCGYEIDSATPGTMNVTWDYGGTAQAMTLLGTVVSTTTGSEPTSVALFGLVNPTPGLKTIAWEALGATVDTNVYIQAQSYTGTATSSVAAATTGYATASGNIGSTAAVTSAASIPSTGQAFTFFIDADNGFTGTFTGGTLIDENEGLNSNAATVGSTGSGVAAVVTAGINLNDTWSASIIGIVIGGVADVLYPQIWL